MKKLKKLVAAMLCLVTVLCTTATAFAAEAPMASIAASDPVVGELTIFSASTPGYEGSSGLNTSGHAFVSFKNTTDNTIKIGGMNVGPGFEITMGTWGNLEQHTGTWYNYESYRINVKGDYSNRASVTTDVKESQLWLLNSTIDYNDTWAYTRNCTAFAIAVWNSVSSDSFSVKLISTPDDLRNEIMERSGYETGREVQYTAPIGYLNWFRNFVSVTASDINPKAVDGTVETTPGTDVFIEEINDTPNSFPGVDVH